jgi:hypothetical protein
MKKEKISIQLTYNENALKYIASIAPNHRTYLISFYFWDGKWKFYTDWIERNGKCVSVDGGFGDEFPMEYFTKLCQAKYMIEKGTLGFPEVELSKSAKKMLTREFLEKKLAKKFGRK